MQQTNEEGKVFEEQTGFLETERLTIFKHYIGILAAK